MFSRRRKNYRVFVITALIVTLCILIIALLWPQAPQEVDDGENLNVTVNANTGSNDKNVDNNEPKVEIEKESESSTASEQKAYYIVKKNGDVISVYFVDENGVQVKLEDTDILYDLLPVDDQKTFEKGMVIENQEQLASLLQDFEG